MANRAITIPRLRQIQRAYHKSPQFIAQETRRAMTEAVGVTKQSIKRRTPKSRRSKRHLRDAIHGRVEGTGAHLTGVVEVDSVDYALFVEEDTKPHIIRAKNARALKFRVGGKTIFRKSVKHPGTKGKHMFEKGAKTAQPKVRKLFKEAEQNIVNHLTQ